ncbi:MAG: hypothetical protein WAL95_12210 [Candidatus Acidiferrales bacterium]
MHRATHAAATTPQLTGEIDVECGSVPPFFLGEAASPAFAPSSRSLHAKHASRWKSGGAPPHSIIFCASDPEHVGRLPWLAREGQILSGRTGTDG